MLVDCRLTVETAGPGSTVVAGPGSTVVAGPGSGYGRTRTWTRRDLAVEAVRPGSRPIKTAGPGSGWLGPSLGLC